MDTVSYFEGRWHEGNTLMLGTRDHATWLGSLVFDGARAMDGCVPDLDRHCQRVVDSAVAMGLEPDMDAAEVEALCRQAVKKFPDGTPLYIRPMFWGIDGFLLAEGTKFGLTVWELPFPPSRGFKACVARTVRRPAPDMAPTDTKAACLYPNVQRGIREAKSRGFDNGIVKDGLGNIAEFMTANIFIVRDGVVKTPVANGCFLAGITRLRVIELLREDGYTVEETVLKEADVMAADEVFSTGNYTKVSYVTQVEDRHLQEGPVAARAHALYRDFARQHPV
jgi:branched-chain amino acid aminotransferase